MIINKLSVLLAERSLSGSRLAVETGIAQSTISKITSNKSKQIDYSTINAICNYLRITPSDFFAYSPIDYDISIIKNEEDNSFNLYIKVKKYDNKLCTLEFIADQVIYYPNEDKPDFLSDMAIDKIKNDYHLVDKLLIELYFSSVEKCDDFYNLPIIFQNTFKADITEQIGKFMKEEMTEEFKNEFIFEKKSFGQTDLIGFNYDSEKHIINIWIGSNVKEHQSDLPF